MTRSARRSAMFMRWLSLAFFHWRVETDQLRPLLPTPLEIDTFEGSAWIGLVPFTMRDVRLTACPRIPTMTHFHECNVRTYVTLNGEPGVWFFSLDASSRLAVRGARRFWHLPYFLSDIAIEQTGDEIRYSVDRRTDTHAAMQCVWKAGDQMPPSRRGDLAHFLTERYCLYAADPRGRIRRGGVQHPQWSLREAELLHLDDTLIEAAGIRIALDLESNPPVAYHADELAVDAWTLETCGD